MKFRRIGVVALAAALAVTMSGCGRGAPSGEETSPGAAIDDKPATGEIEVWAMGTEGELLPELAAEFEADNPDVTVTVTPIPWGEAPQKIQTAIAAGATPDLTMVGADFLPAYVATGGLQAVPEGLVDPGSFYGGAWEGSVIGDYSYAVPWYVETRVLFYRKDMAATAGWDGPPTTWDELREFSIALQSAGATWGVGLPVGQANSWQGSLPYFWQAGGEVLTADGENFDLGSDAMVEALSFIDGMYEDGISNPDPPTGWGESEPLFVDGTSAAFVGGPWQIGVLRDIAGQEFLDEKVGVAVLPAGPAGLTTGYVGGGSWSVFEDAKNSDAAWKFVRWLSQPEQQQKWFDISTDLPAVQAAWDYEPLSSDPIVSVFGEALKDTKGPPLISTWVEVGAKLDTITEQMVRGGLSPVDAAAMMQAEAEAIGVGD